MFINIYSWIFATEVTGDVPVNFGLLCYVFLYLVKYIYLTRSMKGWNLSNSYIIGNCFSKHDIKMRIICMGKD